MTVLQCVFPVSALFLVLQELMWKQKRDNKVKNFFRKKPRHKNEFTTRARAMFVVCITQLFLLLMRIYTSSLSLWSCSSSILGQLNKIVKKDREILYKCRLICSLLQIVGSYSGNADHSLGQGYKFDQVEKDGVYFLIQACLMLMTSLLDRNLSNDDS